MASQVHIPHISSLEWKRVFKLSSSPAQIEENVKEFEEIVGTEPTRIVTFNEGAVLSLVHLQQRFCSHEFNTLAHPAHARQKHYVREALTRNGIPSPSYFVEIGHEIKNIETFTACQQWVAKPNLGMGGRNVRFIQGLEQANEYLTYIAPTPTLYPINDNEINLTEYWGTGYETLFEEYVPGNEYSAELHVIQGRVSSIFVTQKFSSGAPYFLELAHITTPETHLPLTKVDLLQQMQAICEAVGVITTVCHLEFKIVAGKVTVIEVNLRPAGGDICEIWLQATGIDLLLSHLFPESKTSLPKHDLKPHAVIHHTLVGKATVPADFIGKIEHKASMMGIELTTTMIKEAGRAHSPISSEAGFRYAKSVAHHCQFETLQKFVSEVLAEGV